MGDGERITNRALAIHSQDDITYWPKEVREALFICWVKADQQMPAALRLLQEDWEALMATDVDPETGELTVPPYQPIPYQTAASWKHRENWPMRAVQAIAEAFPKLQMEHAALLAHAKGLGLRTLIKVCQDEYPNTKVADRIAAAKELIIAGGAGTYGNMWRQGPVVKDAQADAAHDLAAMTLQELARLEAKTDFETKSHYDERGRGPKS
jgi:hypothetical protein